MPETCFRGAAEALIDTRIVVVQVCESSTVDLLKTIGRMLAQQGELGRVLDEAGQGAAAVAADGGDPPRGGPDPEGVAGTPWSARRPDVVTRF
ncbi:hypothetical protein [Mycobacterium simulans]|uniref:hypothetical protein n=1 Tax=Mycobacterium simulans TaxID=627089 RepID=UPI0017499023|nr:hypothetical protein [Mycobacterium simulans]